jgi:hypothetical protein
LNNGQHGAGRLRAGVSPDPAGCTQGCRRETDAVTMRRAPLTSISAACVLIAAAAAAGQPLTGAVSPDPEPRQAAQATQTPSSSAQQPAPPVERPVNPTQEVASEAPEGPAIAVGPAQLRIGGYLGVTGLYRSASGGGGTGTGFASIPYEDTLQGSVSESRLTAQASRISIRVDADFLEERPRFRKLAGYFEMDFNGAVPGTIAVTSTSAGFRLRHAFAEVRYGETFYMGVGQAFSLMTPQKDQVSIWPSDVEISQAVDTNYLAGLVWGRIPQFRLAWRPSRTFNWAFSLENPEQQLGRSTVTLPLCCATDLNEQYNTGSNGLDVPNLMPDIVTRVAVNAAQAVHVDVGGVFRVFRHSVEPYDTTFKSVGGGASVNASVRATATTKLIGQFATGSGLGRYIGGLVPDVTFTADSSIQPLGTRSWVAGIEQQVSPVVSLAGYYSGVDTDDSVATDVDGSSIGYGYPGASSSNNKRIEELTVTSSLLAFKSANRGSAQISLQFSWLEREPWFHDSGPESASMLMFFAQVRYNLP